MIRCRDFSSQQLRKDVKGGSHSPALIEMVQFLDKVSRGIKNGKLFPLCNTYTQKFSYFLKNQLFPQISDFITIFGAFCNF